MREILAMHSISAVPVVGWDGVPVGVVSETDLIRKQEKPQPPKVLAGQQARERWHKAIAERASELVTVPVRAVSANHGVVTLTGRLDHAWNDQAHNQEEKSCTAMSATGSSSRAPSWTTRTAGAR